MTSYLRSLYSHCVALRCVAIPPLLVILSVLSSGANSSQLFFSFADDSPQRTNGSMDRDLSLPLCCHAQQQQKKRQDGGAGRLYRRRIDANRGRQAPQPPIYLRRLGKYEQTVMRRRQ